MDVKTLDSGKIGNGSNHWVKCETQSFGAKKAHGNNQTAYEYYIYFYDGVCIMKRFHRSEVWKWELCEEVLCLLLMLSEEAFVLICVSAWDRMTECERMRVCMWIFNEKSINIKH